ncbi:GNAT family N-acetyltransferase [Nocardia sp. IFM 10818]
MREAGRTTGRPVRQGTTAELRTVSGLLARAFVDDPMTMWLHPNASARLAKQHTVFELQARYALASGNGIELAVDQSAGLVGAALWLAPHRRSPAMTLSERATLWRAYGRHYGRAAAATRLIWSSHVQEPHRHLLSIATAREFRGRGYARHLMESGLDRCRAEGLPAHLETSKPENLPFYGRLGFEVTTTVALPGGGPTVWLLRHQP